MTTDKTIMQDFTTAKLNIMKNQIQGYKQLAKQYDKDGLGNLAHQQRLYARATKKMLKKLEKS